MTSGDSPVVARRRVRLALREAREGCGYTQGQVAEAMEWSLSKVMRIESGEVAISVNDLRPLLAHLGIADRATVDELTQAARASRGRQEWWNQPRFRETLTAPMRHLIQYEAGATAFHYFHQGNIPGPLQTPAYARAMLGRYRDLDELTDHEVDGRYDARMRRRDQLLRRSDRFVVSALIDESALHRWVGGAAVTGEQLSDLIIRTEDVRYKIRIIQFESDSPAMSLGAFEILDLDQPGNDQNAVMYRESHTVDEILEDPAKIRRHRDIFDLLWQGALDEQSSATLIEQRAKDLARSARPSG